MNLDLERVKSVDEGVRKMLAIRENEIPEFEIIKRSEGEFTDTLVFSGMNIPLAFWRYEPRLHAMHCYGANVAENCCVNTYSFVGEDVSLEELIYRELDISEYELGSPIIKVTAFINGGACNLIAKTESGALANLELGVTMAKGTVPQFSHRLITRHGMASDRTVNNLVEQSGVYVFGNNDTRPVTFDDGEYYLYGLAPEECWKVMYIRAILLGELDANFLIGQDRHLKRVLSSIFLSAKDGESVYIGEAGDGEK